MKAVSANYLAAMRGGGGTLSMLAFVYDSVGDPVGLNFSEEGEIFTGGPKPLAQLFITAGDFVADRTADVRRRVENLTFVAKPLDFDGPVPDPLSLVSGGEIRLYVGFLYGAPANASEFFPLGVFGFADRDVIDQPSRFEVTMNVYDRQRRFRRARLTAPYQVAEATPVLQAAQDFARFVDPHVTMRVVGSSRFTTPALTFDEEADPWECLERILRSGGFEPFYDSDGNLAMQLEPDIDDPNAVPSFTYDDSEDTTMTEVTRSGSNESVYNGVIVTGQSTSLDAPVRGEAWDDNPASPTYYLGPYGKVPRFLRSEYISTADQASDAARAELRRVRNLTEAISWSAVPNYAQEEGDFVKVASARSGVNAVVFLDRFRFPLRAGLMSCEARPRTL